MVDYSGFDAVAQAAAQDEEKEKALKEAERQERLEERKKQAEGEASESSSEDDAELHPLFWTKLPEGNQEADDLKEAFTNMIYEDRTPDELAEDFKAKGNEAFKWGKKFYDNALKYYKEGLEWSSKGSHSIENRTVYAAILSNRAAVQLSRKNYGKVLRDCKAAIKFGPKPLPNCKPYFRAATACAALERYPEALTFLADAIAMDPENSALLKLKEKVEVKHAAVMREKREKEIIRVKERRMEEKVRKACVKKKIRLGPLIMDISRYTGSTVVQGKFPLPTVNEDGSLTWKVMIMYPEHSTSDFIQEWGEHESFQAHLERMFPSQGSGLELRPEWDREGYYCLEDLCVFFEERYVRSLDMSRMWEKQLAKAKSREEEENDYSAKLRVQVKLSHTLLAALQDSQYVVPGVPLFYVVSKASPYWNVYKEQHRGRIRLL